MVGPRRIRLLALGLIGLAWAAASPARSQERDGEVAAGPTMSRAPAPTGKGAAKADPGASRRGGPAAVGRSSVLRLVATGNPMLWPLALCSVVALGFALERLVALRRSRVIPRDFVDRFVERLSTGKLDRERAVELCKANDSPVARVFAHAIRYWGQPAAAIRQAIGSDASGELIDLRRNVRVLNGTATLAPLLGLLGTVIGMIESFDALGVGGRGAADKGEQLAHGISLALVATAVGLAIAIVSVTAYYYLLNRIDVLVRELDEQAIRVIDLVAAEGGRTSGVGDRWGTISPGDHARLESRTLGRADPI